MRLSRFCAAALFCAAVCAAKAPITHQDVWLMKQVGAPIPSPDGKWVVFSVTEPAYDEKDQISDLWIVPAEGTAPRRLTATKGGESGAAWSPDSRRVAFSGKREGDEVNQIYVIDIGGGEAARVTSISTGASAPRWRPDGEAIVFTSFVYPGAANDDANKSIAAARKALKHRARVYDSFPIRQWDHWLDDRRPHLFVQELKPDATAKDLLAGSQLTSQPGYAGVPTTTSADLQAVWAPDGESLIFAATANRDSAAYASVVTHLYRVPASGGEPVAITTGADSYSSPRFRPDGKALYCLVEAGNANVYNINRLAMFAWPHSGERTTITASLDRSVGAFAFSPDSKTVYLLAEEHGREKLFRVTAGGGDATRLFDVRLGAYTNLAIPAHKEILLANWESSVHPAEVVRIDPAAANFHRLTDFNTLRANQIDWQPLREFWTETKSGRKVHSLLALPPGFDESKKYPLFVMMHGGPHSMWRDQFFVRWNYHLLASPGYVVVLTNYVGSTGYGEKFAQNIQGDPLKTPAAEINEAADDAIKRFPFIDGARQAAGGASYGGHLANWMQATTRRYKCLISHAGLINLESQWGTSDVIYHHEVGAGGPVWEQGPVWREQNPIRFARNFRTPILLTVGEKDYRVPLNQTLENWSVLQRLRVPSRLVVFEEANHWIGKGEDSRFFYQELHAWLARHL
jgi:dipeptidyl aminopeptidase/acylaminoacyl peptidase